MAQDNHFENEPTYPPKNVSPLSKEWIEKIEQIKAERDSTDPATVSPDVSRRI